MVEFLDFVVTIEYQKTENPHAYCLFCLKEPIRDDDVGKCISPEIPDPITDKDLHIVKVKNNLHGPCGSNYPESRCVWVEKGDYKKCPKSFPKELIDVTINDSNGYPQYRRRSILNGGRQVQISIKGSLYHVGNEFIVSYNSILSKAFDVHINAELCRSVKAIKYLFKYVYKGQIWLMRKY